MLESWESPKLPTSRTKLDGLLIIIRLMLYADCSQLVDRHAQVCGVHSERCDNILTFVTVYL